MIEALQILFAFYLGGAFSVSVGSATEPGFFEHPDIQQMPPTMQFVAILIGGLTWPLWIWTAQI
jgi:hypothetical protein